MGRNRRVKARGRRLLAFEPLQDRRSLTCFSANLLKDDAIVDMGEDQQAAGEYWLEPALPEGESDFDAGDWASLVQGVNQIFVEGDPGPVHGLTSDWMPIVGGGENSSVPSTFVVARIYGTGRIVALGHSGLFDALDELDNGILAENVVRWLDAMGGREVRRTTGHGERTSASQLANLAALTNDGYSFADSALNHRPTELNGVSVLIIDAANSRSHLRKSRPSGNLCRVAGDCGCQVWGGPGSRIIRIPLSKTTR